MKSFKTSVKGYYRLTKPGIIRGNAITATAGFLLAAKSQISIGLFFAMLSGISLVIASACVFNNYIDKDIDKKMTRTKNRSLVIGDISGQNALIYASLLGLAGAAILGVYTNLISLFAALFGFFAYVVLYTIAKRRSVHGTVVGSISGAIPPVVGYSVVTNQLDAVALILFLVLVAWQMPHFYAIALYRKEEYKAASIPVLPIIDGVRSTKKQVLLYIIGFGFLVLSLSYFGYAGYTYAVVMTAVWLLWLRLAVQGFAQADTVLWAKKLFGFSLVVLLTFSIMISLEAWLP